VTRTFSTNQRVALFLGSDGKCASCGAELQPGWHADHVQPWSKGGETDVVNGQALCPTCNLRKGATSPMRLREWQEQALTEFNKGKNDFLAVACPGAGKTTFALEAASRLRNNGAVSRVIVVAPTSHLKRQWSVAANRFGLHLDDRFENGHGRFASDFVGVAVTYSAVATNPQIYRRLAAEERTLVILDEIHHAGEADNLTWGVALKTAFGDLQGCRRLLLSGTPFRSDRRPIPFVSYDMDGHNIADYEYGYGEALSDGIVRPIEFPAMNGDVQWRRASIIQKLQLSDATDEVLASALAAALAPEGHWVKSVLAEANRRLDQIREEVPDAGGLVIARDSFDARQYAQILRDEHGETPAVVLHDEPDATTRIEDFSHGKGKWIVAVRMVSEGVDIPRLLVGVYATNARTEMFFRQVVGRFVRRRGEDDDMSATLFIPHVEPLLRFASAVERDVEQALAEARERMTPESSEAVIADFSLADLESGEAMLERTIRSGREFTEGELERVRAYMESHQWPASVSPAQAAQMLRALGASSPTEPAKAVAGRSLTKSDRKRELRRQIQARVARLANATGEDYSLINGRLKQKCGGEIAQADEAQLERRMELLAEWQAKAGI